MYVRQVRLASTSQKPHKKHKSPNKHDHHGGEAVRGVDLMSPCCLRGGRPCAYLFQCRCRSDLTALPLWAQICAHFFNELRASLITFPNFVCCQRLIARNVAELSSSNRGISHLNETCRINELSRGFVLGYEILTNN